MAFEILKMPRNRFRMGGSNVHEVDDGIKTTAIWEYYHTYFYAGYSECRRWYEEEHCAREASQLLTVSDRSIPKDPIMSQGTHKPWIPLE
jgi:hypothetical protein